MSHYTFPARLQALYDQAVSRQQSGPGDLATYFTSAELSFLAANGLTAQNLYDYAEDHLSYGEPGWNNALAIEMVRRDYFLTAQRGRPSDRTLDIATLPAKTAAVQGIEWLPRLIPKARAKLRGELPSSLMYGCGGDRRFFQQHDIHPAEFLSLVWRHESDDTAIVEWVVQRKNSAVSVQG
jgi:Domain of unknown function (DUF5069)